MSKQEVELRNLEPGTVVKVPPQKLSGYGEYAMFMGGSYYGDYPDVYPKILSLNTNSGELCPMHLAHMPEGSKFELANKEVTAKIRKLFKKSYKLEKDVTLEATPNSGTDPEVFVVDSKNEVIPAWKFLPAKEQKIRLGENYVQAYQTGLFFDGFQAEWTPPGKSCLQQLMEGVRGGMQEMLLRAKAVDPLARFTLDNTIEIPKKMLEETDEEHIRFRCSPSINIYGDAGEPVPEAREYKYRFAGGHIHAGIGYKRTAPVIAEVIRALDAIVGVAGVSLAASFDTPERRRMYGRAGEFRLPKHGIEYRVLSNFWLASPAIAHLVFELNRFVVRLGMGGVWRAVWEYDEDETRRVINECDVDGARKILAKNSDSLLKMFEKIWPVGKHLLGPSYPAHMKENVKETDFYPAVDAKPEHAKLAVKTILSGIETVIEHPKELELNWDLEGKKWSTYGGHPGGCWTTLQSPQR